MRVERSLSEGVFCLRWCASVCVCVAAGYVLRKVRMSFEFDVIFLCVKFHYCYFYFAFSIRSRVNGTKKKIAVEWPGEAWTLLWRTTIWLGNPGSLDAMTVHASFVYISQYAHICQLLCCRPNALVVRAAVFPSNFPSNRIAFEYSKRWKNKFVIRIDFLHAYCFCWSWSFRKYGQNDVDIDGNGNQPPNSHECAQS